MTPRSKLRILLSVTLCAVLIGGCTSSAPPGNSSSKAPAAVPHANVTGEPGRAAASAVNPQRIVSLAPSDTEILYALGLGDRLVGVDDYSDYPPPAALLPRMGGMINVSVDRVVAARPDLVLAGPFTPNATIDRLLAAGLNVYTTNPHSIRSAMSVIMSIGKLCGVPDRAQRLIDRMRMEVDEVAEQTSALDTARLPTVLMIITLGNESYVAGTEGYMGDLIAVAGGRNIASGNVMTPAEIVQADPDLIIVPLTDWTLDTFEGLKYGREPWMRDLAAVRAGRVYPVGYDVVGRPGPRAGYAVTALARIMHPELFYP